MNQATTKHAIGAGASALSPLGSRPDNLTNLVFQAIRDSIVDQTLAPGSRVREARVAAELQVSKTPVREALLRLRHLGLVEPVEGGLRVVRPSIHAIRNAYEFRAGIERSAALFAAHRATTGERKELLVLAQSSLRAAEDANGSEFRSYDNQFHRLIAQASRNEVLRQAVEDSLVLTAVLRERDVPRSGDSRSCASEHTDVAKAILEGEAGKAADQNEAHVLHVMSLVLAARGRVDANGN